MPDTDSIHIGYYVSGHGFGHATRAAQLMVRLLESSSPILRITLSTMAPRHLFPDSPRITYRARELESAVMQPSPYDIDARATFRDLTRVMHEQDGGAWVAQEMAFLQSAGIHAILTDAAWTVGLLRLQYPTRCPKTIMVSNFTFDLIFRDLMRHDAGPTEEEEEGHTAAMVDTITRAHNGITHLVTLPGYIDFPFLSLPENRTRVSHGPLIYRPPRSEKANVLADLHVPRALAHSKILLVQFGGHTTAADHGAVPMLPDGWICLSSVRIDGPRFFQFTTQMYLPDLVQSCDVVLGKIGYGTVSECVGMGKPLLFVKREMFAEEPYLLKYHQQHGICHELSKTDFEQGRWREALLAIESQKSKENRTFGVADQSGALARMVLALIQEDEVCDSL